MTGKREHKGRREIGNLLNKMVKEANNRRALENDPLQFPHRYKKRDDREIAALFSALLAWGKRSIIIAKLEDLFARMGPSPAEFVRNYSEKGRASSSLSGFKHRTFRDRDIVGLVIAAREAYVRYGSLEGLFIEGLQRSGSGGAQSRQGVTPLQIALAYFVVSLKESAERAGFPLVANFLPDPLAGSACKRIILFLRWMVRKREFDLGLWNCIGPESLIIPLDISVGIAARCLGFTKRKTNDWKAAEEITEALRAYDPRDPVRFDFALSQYCSPERRKGACAACGLKHFKSGLYTGG